MFNIFRKNKKNPEKIIILRFGAIGDVVHTSALFRSIKNASPNTSIHYLTFKVPSLLLKNDPDLDKVWIAENKSYKYLLKLANELKKEKFDTCINLQPSIRTKLFLSLLGAENNIVYKKTFKLHAVKNFWITVKYLFENLKIDDDLKLYLDDKVKRDALNLIDNDKKLIAFNIGANSQRQGRKWPIEYWTELAKLILKKYDYKIVITGSKEEEQDAKNIKKISDSVFSFCGKLSIDQSAALISNCKVMVSGDTGPLHIANATGISVIGLYGSTPILRTGPYGKKASVLKSNRKCVPCNKRKCKYISKNAESTPCLLDIKPEKVLRFIDLSLTS